MQKEEKVKMISFSLLLFFVFFFISQYTCIGGGSWFEGKRSPEKRSKQCGPWQGSSCFKKLKRPVFFTTIMKQATICFWKKEVFNAELDGTAKVIADLKG